MPISPQLPQFVIAARSSALQALALQAGQMIEGEVIGPAPNGGTQVKIAGQMLNLLLPVLAKPGETLRFQVQGSGAQIKLALQPSHQAPTAPPQAPPLPPGQTSLPVAAVQVQPQSNILPPAPAVTPGPVQPAISSGSAPAAPTPANATQTPLSQAPAATLPRPESRPTVTTPAAKTPASPYPPLQPQSRPQAPLADLPPTAHKPTLEQTAAPRSGPTTQPASTSSPATTPQAALAQMVQSALPRQDSIANLMTALTAIAGKTALPEPVIRAAQQVLAGRVAVDGGKLDGAVLQKAVLNSGIFQEAKLANGQAQAPAMQADQKATLLALRQTLTTWLGPLASSVAPAMQLAPPMRGQGPRARVAEAPRIDPDAPPAEIGKQLLERTEASLARLRLHQSASLPDLVAKTADWSMDLPILVGTQQTVLHLQIHRDAEDTSDAPTERGWQMRFALNLPQLGEVGAQVSMRGGATGVMLWATERETSEALESDLGALRQTLAATGLRAGAVIVRHGEPPMQAAAASGHFLDART